MLWLVLELLGMRTTDRTHRTIFPVLISPIEREMLTRLSMASGLSRCAVVRELILRETASRELIRQTPHEAALARSNR